jgi:hypothetical protein
MLDSKAQVESLFGANWQPVFWCPSDWHRGSHPSPLLCRVLGAKVMGQTKLARPASHALDEKMAAAVWEVSAQYAGLPVEPVV